MVLSEMSTFTFSAYLTYKKYNLDSLVVILNVRIYVWKYSVLENETGYQSDLWQGSTQSILCLYGYICNDSRTKSNRSYK